MRTALRCTALAIVTALAACSSDTGRDDLATDQDIAEIGADAAAQDVELMGAARGDTNLSIETDADDESLAPFRCGTFQRYALTIVRTCTFQDADGATQSDYDHELTATAIIGVEVTGESIRDNRIATVDRERTLTATGLLGIETSRTWNGSGNGTANITGYTRNGQTREYDVTSTLTVTNVVIPVPRRPDGWPLSGTITHQATIVITGGPRDGETIERTVTITFNGTRFVPIEINGHIFTYDLLEKQIVRD